MEITVTPEVEEYIASKVASEAYASPSEVCEAAIRLLEDHEEDRDEKLAAFNEELGQRLASLNYGEHVDPEASRERLRQKSELRKSVPA
jgi:antitoxin ParD1/3/4